MLKRLLSWFWLRFNSVNASLGVGCNVERSTDDLVGSVNVVNSSTKMSNKTGDILSEIVVLEESSEHWSWKFGSDGSEDDQLDVVVADLGVFQHLNR